MKVKHIRYVLYSGLLVGGGLFLGTGPAWAQENTSLPIASQLKTDKSSSENDSILSDSSDSPVESTDNQLDREINPSKVSSEISAEEVYPAEETVLETRTTVNHQEVAPTSIHLEKDMLQVEYHESQTAQEQISFAVWTDYQGQDDLLWYLADAQGKAQIPLKKHGEFGSYQIHTYSSLEGHMTFRDKTTFEVPKPDPKVHFEALTNTSYRIRVSGLDETISAVSVPIWSKRNGQDDLKWYEASRQSDGGFETVFDAENHNFDKGYYFVHIYGFSDLLDRQVGLAATEGFTLNPQNSKGQWSFNHDTMHWDYKDEAGQVLKTAETISSASGSGTSHPFLTAIYNGAIESLKYGVLPSITAAQAILESGWGKSGLSAQPNHNLFGIKASTDWEGETVSLPTQEFVNGRYITINDAFRKYKSWSESVLDHSRFFTSTPWRKENYKEFVGELNYKVAAQKLYQAGYATDPNYATKLIELIELYGLNEWDKVSD